MMTERGASGGGMQSTQEGQDKEWKKIQGSMKVMAIIAVKGQMLDDFSSQLRY